MNEYNNTELSIVVPVYNESNNVKPFLDRLYKVLKEINLKYEMIKITSKSNSVFFYFLKKPGIYLQNITTKQPDDNMVEVSIAAIKDAFGDKYEEFRGQEFTAEAIG